MGLQRIKVGPVDTNCATCGNPIKRGRTETWSDAPAERVVCLEHPLEVHPMEATAALLRGLLAEGKRLHLATLRWPFAMAFREMCPNLRVEVDERAVGTVFVTIHPPNEPAHVVLTWTPGETIATIHQLDRTDQYESITVDQAEIPALGAAPRLSTRTER